jgi:hypothetical protein
VRSYETLKSEPQNIEYRTAECRRVESRRSVFFKIDRSTQKLNDRQNTLFDVSRHCHGHGVIGRSMIDVRQFLI